MSVLWFLIPSQTELDDGEITFLYTHIYKISKAVQVPCPNKYQFPWTNLSRKEQQSVIQVKCCIERSSSKETLYTSECNYGLLESFTQPVSFHGCDADDLSITNPHRNATHSSRCVKSFGHSVQNCKLKKLCSKFHSNPPLMECKLDIYGNLQSPRSLFTL